jgi:hypothetical protein
MLKKISLLSLLFLLASCQPGMTYTTHSEYKVEREIDKEKGFIEKPHVKWSAKWEN